MTDHNEAGQTDAGTPMEAHLAENESTGEYTCYDCGDTYELRYMAEDTGRCDQCAQVKVTLLELELAASQQRITRYIKIATDRANEIAALHVQLADANARCAELESQWHPIDTAPKQKKILAGYMNLLGNWRTITARYYGPETLECDDSDSGWADEGWYEESESHETLLRTDCEPTHWMPLPQSALAEKDQP